jgi:hypothetical protein
VPHWGVILVANLRVLRIVTRARQPLRVNTMPDSRNLTAAKEQVVVMYILKLVTRGESP